MKFQASSQFSNTDLCPKLALLPGVFVRKTPIWCNILYDEHCIGRKVRPYQTISDDFPPVYARYIDQPLLTNEFIVHKGSTIFVDTSIHSAGMSGANEQQILADFSAAIEARLVIMLSIQHTAEESAMVFQNEGSDT